jgi:hypothetical protein
VGEGGASAAVCGSHACCARWWEAGVDVFVGVVVLDIGGVRHSGEFGSADKETEEEQSERHVSNYRDGK